jgi:thiol-disulfide isomerase/thioredoxin
MNFDHHERLVTGPEVEVPRDSRVEIDQGASKSMRKCIRCGQVGALAVTSALMIQFGALAQGVANPGSARATQAPSTGDSVQKIAEDYHRQLIDLDRRRLDRLTRLAASQQPAEAAATYEQLLRLAIEGNLFREAEPAALAVIDKGSRSAATVALAHLVKIIAECDRGAYEQSLESLRTAILWKESDQIRQARPQLLTPEKVELCDAYYQRLIHAGQFELARKAFLLLKEHAQSPQFARFLEARLGRLDLVGKPAPAIQGTDLDGKNFDLADSRGKVVLVVFWATWCVPCAAEVAALREVADTYRGKGFQVVSVNVDALQDGGQKLETVLPGVHRFLIDHNVTWPTLINGTGDQDFAKAYGVTEIPANVLIARDGTIASIDLVRQNLETTVARVVGR